MGAANDYYEEAEDSMGEGNEEEEAGADEAEAVQEDEMEASNEYYVEEVAEDAKGNWRRGGEMEDGEEDP